MRSAERILLIATTLLAGLAASAAQGRSQPAPATPSPAAPAGFTVIHSFAGPPADGAQPHGSLTVVGTQLYGRSYAGGAQNFGTIFSIATDGTGMTVLHSFSGPPNDGAYPRHDSMLLVGSTLYGMTVAGGAMNLGTIFRIDTDGSGYQVLHQFMGAPDDGSTAHSVLALYNGVLYGMTQLGGQSDQGTLFRINPDGSGSQVLVSFSGANGAEPHGTPHVVGDTLYGMTRKGGTNKLGVVFAYTPGTGAFQLLHQFTGAPNDGALPYHSNLVWDGAAGLYGMTYDGGAADKGVIFTLNPDGSGYRILRSFQGGAADGAQPLGTLVVAGTTLYGTTDHGGPTNNGAVFSIQTDGSGYEVRHIFSGPDGANPPDNVVLLNGMLYGMTQQGGASANGTIFALAP